MRVLHLYHNPKLKFRILGHTWSITNISQNIFFHFQSAEEQFKLHYVPGDTTVDITLERLEVEEGARRTISKKYLNVMAPDIVHFVFNITRTPKHGTIDILAPNKVDIVRANTTFFTSDEIESDRVVYNHDDSESRRDTFHFVAMASRGQGKANNKMFIMCQLFAYIILVHILVLCEFFFCGMQEMRIIHFEF